MSEFFFFFYQIITRYFDVCWQHIVILTIKAIDMDRRNIEVVIVFKIFSWYKWQGISLQTKIPHHTNHKKYFVYDNLKKNTTQITKSILCMTTSQKIPHHTNHKKYLVYDNFTKILNTNHCNFKEFYMRWCYLHQYQLL